MRPVSFHNRRKASINLLIVFFFSPRPGQDEPQPLVVQLPHGEYLRVAQVEAVGHYARLREQIHGGSDAALAGFIVTPSPPQMPRDERAEKRAGQEGGEQGG